MEKYIYNEQNGLWYELQGDYYIPCLVLDEEDTQPIGMWGRKRLDYLKKHRQALYTTLLVSGKLNSHLDICEYCHTAPTIITKINALPNATEIFDRNYSKLFLPCVTLIESGNNDVAYHVYKNST